MANTPPPHICGSLASPSAVVHIVAQKYETVYHLTTVTVDFTFRADQFAFLNEEMQWVVEAGNITVRVGASSEDIRLEGRFHVKDNGSEGYNGDNRDQRKSNCER